MELDIQMFATPYVNFKDAPNTTTPVSSTNLNKIQTDARTEIGTLSSLTTSTKTNLVAAINEVDSHADSNANAITSINTILSTLMQWKLAGSVTGGTNTVTLPENFNELLIIIRIADNASVNININIPYTALTTAETGFNGGYYQGSNVNAHARALVTTTTAKIGIARLNNNDALNTTSMRVYYR